MTQPHDAQGLPAEWSRLGRHWVMGAKNGSRALATDAAWHICTVPSTKPNSGWARPGLDGAAGLVQREYDPLLSLHFLNSGL